ncbi:helix-turn-helix transcriptional regulator [Rhizobium leguminosarum]|uniref:helix-turn-helix domain-containing protein n=1 Tax=Rhizobium leguminosarum TaxID=384 RepID=UPI001C951268|nr:helix-turn-helix domain-containing protein [Rhizobium leguminosarum]MBY5565958.1 helix-turn-helix transcriptional regulator [Rhizobium leguminosarum]MBY5573062.1 helix-turn-helix transcriptional regulator [Rhizobium leguminosarum]
MTFPWLACSSRYMDSLPDLLRAARCLLGYTQTGIEDLFKLKSRSVYTLEAGRYKLTPRFAYLLKEKYEEEGVEFTDAGSDFGQGIRWRVPGRKDPYRRAMLPAARGLANLSQAQLAKIADVDQKFIARLELDDFEAVSRVKLDRLEAALKARNVEFTSETTSFGAGVRWIKIPEPKKSGVEKVVSE